MTYASGSTILATDYNGLVGASPGTTANQLNTVWAVGGNAAGYGQTAEANVAVGDTVTASKWANLVNKTSNAGTHQGSTLTAVTAPVAGGTITYLSAIPTNLTTIYTNKLNAGTQGTSSPTTVTRVGTWTNQLTYTFTATFPGNVSNSLNGGDAARYFFNSGGQLKFTFSHPTGSAIDNSLNALASACGTITLSAPSSGTATIAATSYNGVTKVGGSGTVNSISSTSGYYGLGTANTLIFKQLVASAPAGYANTNINLNAKTNGIVGSYSDNGNVITVYVQFAELTSTGLTAASGTAVTMAIVPPETTNIANTWGAITPAGSVTGS
jgi:hypothetical protein